MMVSFVEADYENVVPAQYADPLRSGLDVEIGAGADPIEIALH